MASQATTNQPDWQQQESINQQEWQRSENWSRLIGIYRSARDTRVWVPKRNPGFGMTLNFAHRAAWWSLVGLLTVPIGFVILFILLQLFR